MPAHTHTVRCPVPTCGHAEVVEQPVGYVPSFLAHEAGDALHRKVERMRLDHAEAHSAAEWWSACMYYVAHVEREVARSHTVRLRTGPAVWTQPDGSQVDVMIRVVLDVGIHLVVGGSAMNMTDPDLLAQVTMTQVRAG